MKNIETRYITTELRLFGDNQRTLKGTIPYGVLSEDLGGFRERIAAGAFAKSIAQGDIRAFWNHRDDELPLGRTSANTMRLADGEQGLEFEIDLPDTTRGNDLRVSMQRGDVNGVSFGFVSSRDNWTEGGKIRTLIEANLVEISPVNFPAYPDAAIALRSLEQWQRDNTPAPAVQPDRKKLLEILERRTR